VASGSAIAAAHAAPVSDLADRVLALRRSLAEKGTSVEGTGPWINPTVLEPGTRVAQWKKWKNG
jgi:hypothetical protein